MTLNVDISSSFTSRIKHFQHKSIEVILYHIHMMVLYNVSPLGMPIYYWPEIGLKALHLFFGFIYYLFIYFELKCNNKLFILKIYSPFPKGNHWLRFQTKKAQLDSVHLWAQDRSNIKYLKRAIPGSLGIHLRGK